MKTTLIIAFVLYAAVTCPAGELLVLSEEFPPFQYTQDTGRVSGFGIELVTRIFRDAGIGMAGNKVHIHPWSRTFLMLKTTGNAAAFMTVKNPQRTPMFKWVGPLAPRAMWLFKLRERKDITIKTLEQAKAYKVGGYRSAQTDYLIELGFPRIQIVDHEAQNLVLLMAGRVDLVPSLELTMAARLKRMGKSYCDVKKTILFDGRFDYYLAINPRIPDAVVARLQQSLDRLKQNQTYDQLMQRYLN